MNIAIYKLPEPEILNLEYLQARLLLIGLNGLRKQYDHKEELYERVAQEMGLSGKTIWNKMREFGIAYDAITERYYVLNDNPILKYSKNN